MLQADAVLQFVCFCYLANMTAVVCFNIASGEMLILSNILSLTGRESYFHLPKQMDVK